jgi:hypothetical protein
LNDHAGQSPGPLAQVENKWETLKLMFGVLIRMKYDISMPTDLSKFVKAKKKM